jgi:hypothetical protein
VAAAPAAGAGGQVGQIGQALPAYVQQHQLAMKMMLDQQVGDQGFLRIPIVLPDVSGVAKKQNGPGMYLLCVGSVTGVSGWLAYHFINQNVQRYSSPAPALHSMFW